MRCDAKWCEANVVQCEVQVLSLNSGGETCMGNFMCQKVNTGRLNMNGQQESEHKAHLKQSYRKCLTVQCNDS